MFLSNASVYFAKTFHEVGCRTHICTYISKPSPKMKNPAAAHYMDNPTFNNPCHPPLNFFTEAQVIKFVCTQNCESNSSLSQALPLFALCTDFTAVGPRILSGHISNTDSCIQHLCSASKITFKGEQTERLPLFAYSKYLHLIGLL